MAERGREQLDDLADRQHLVVADVEDRARGRVGLFDREQQRVREVLGVAVVVQREAVVGDDDAVAAVEDAAHDRPLARRELVRTVDVRIAEVRGARMVREHRLLGADDAVALLVVRGRVDGRRVLGDRHRQAGRVERATGSSSRGTRARRRPTRSGRRGPRSAPRCARSRPYIATTTSNVWSVEQVAQRVVVVRVGVDVHDLGGRLGALVRAAVQDRDVVAVLDEPRTIGMPVGPVPPITDARCHEAHAIPGVAPGHG